MGDGEGAEEAMTGVMLRGIRGRTALVTGGGGGLGRPVVAALLQAGAQVHVPTFGKAEAEAEALREVGRAVLRGEGDPGKPGAQPASDRREDGGPGGPGAPASHPALTLHEGVDLTDADAVEALVAAVPPVELLLNLAGGFTMAPIHKTEPEGWEGMMAMNARTAFLVSRAVLPAMRDARFGRVVCVSALPALRGGTAEMGAYGASKAAVLHLVEVLAREGRAFGITANAILPEIIDTPGNREAMPDADRKTWLAPEAIARVLLFLLSEEGGIVTGAAVPLQQSGAG